MSGKLNVRFQPGKVWLDTDGEPIQSHGGGILYEDGVYYWYGENKDGETLKFKNGLNRVDVIGISCYSSRDLLNWKNEGVVLPSEKEDPNHDLHISKVVERPKVIRNPNTGKYVMWVHIDVFNYEYARTGIAISDTPTGPFRYMGSMNPNGGDSRDMTIFQDDDGMAYLFHSSEWNKTMYIAPLSYGYLGTIGTYTRNFIDQSREAPAVFKFQGKYYMFSSGCTGWDPNEAEVAISDCVTGPWNVLGNPCVGEDADKTFYAQSTFVLPVRGKKDAFIFMADQWNKDNLRDSMYTWLPIQFKDGQIIVEWIDEWDLSFFD